MREHIRIDLNRTHGLAINGQKITNEFINNLYSNHKNLILRDENGKGNYRPFLRQIFTEMFKHVGAIIPNNSIIEELINNYYQGGYTHFLPNDMNQALGSIFSFVNARQLYDKRVYYGLS